MRRRSAAPLTASFLLLCLVQAPAATAQPQDGGGRAKGKAPADGKQQKDLSKEPLVRIEGEVLLLKREGGSEGGSGGTPMLTIRTTTGETVVAQVGPPRLRKEAKMDVQIGDVVKIEGWKDTSRGFEQILTRTLTEGDKTLEVRDATGRQLWERIKGEDIVLPYEDLDARIVGFGHLGHKPQGAKSESAAERGIVAIDAGGRLLYVQAGDIAYRRSKGLELAAGDQVKMGVWDVGGVVSGQKFMVVRYIQKGTTRVEIRDEKRRILPAQPPVTAGKK